MKAGETILILDRDEPVARLERVLPDAHPQDRLGRLERSGLVRRAGAPLPLAELRALPPSAGQSVLDALLEDRREGR